MSMIDALDTTLAALEPGDVDAAAAELARLYARQLDQAAAIRAQADKTLRAAEREGDDALIEQVAALRAKLGERECVDRIGARFHALLAELLATPKSRPAKTAAPASTGALGKLRAVK